MGKSYLDEVGHTIHISDDNRINDVGRCSIDSWHSKIMGIFLSLLHNHSMSAWQRLGLGQMKMPSQNVLTLERVTDS